MSPFFKTNLTVLIITWRPRGDNKANLLGYLRHTMIRKFVDWTQLQRFDGTIVKIDAISDSMAGAYANTNT